MPGRISERLKDVFGHSALPDGLFYSFEFALRFELGGDADRHLSRFLQAVERARAVVRAVFPRVEDIDVLLEHYAPALLTHEDARELQALRRTGFQPRLMALERLPLTPEEAEFWSPEEPIYRYLAQARPGSTMADIDALLWSSCAVDMGVQPRASFRIYLVDYARGVAVHVYDDRGMDVVATSPAAIEGIYSQFSNWLLDYDRDRMKAAFERD